LEGKHGLVQLIGLVRVVSLMYFATSGAFHRLRLLSVAICCFPGVAALPAHFKSTWYVEVFGFMVQANLTVFSLLRFSPVWMKLMIGMVEVNDMMHEISYTSIRWTGIGFLEQCK
jgi:hypothetical protein